LWKCLLLSSFFYPPRGVFRHFFSDHKMLWSFSFSNTILFPVSGSTFRCFFNPPARESPDTKGKESEKSKLFADRIFQILEHISGRACGGDHWSPPRYPVSILPKPPCEFAVFLCRGVQCTPLHYKSDRSEKRSFHAAKTSRRDYPGGCVRINYNDSSGTERCISANRFLAASSGSSRCRRRCRCSSCSPRPEG